MTAVSLLGVVPPLLDAALFVLPFALAAALCAQIYMLYLSSAGASEDKKLTWWHAVLKAARPAEWLMSGWVVGLGGSIVMLLDVYAGWRFLRVFDVDSLIWLSAVLIHLLHFVPALLWGPALFLARAPGFAAIVAVLWFLTVAAANVLFWLLPTMGTTSLLVYYSYSAAAAHLAPALGSAYLAVVTARIAAASLPRGQTFATDRLGAAVRL